MGTYKVIQDIEAEDKLLGPLTLRQFIYAAIAAVCLYLCFLSFAKHAVFLVVIFLPIAAMCGFFAFPFRRDQPTEVWALARIQFMLKPHKRIWNQSGIKELVTVNAPKRNTRIYTDGLSRAEVQSRLKALASTIDTRGWATKNVNVNLYQAQVDLPGTATSDRLISAPALPKPVSDIDVAAADDVLDEKNNPTAYNLDQLINSSTQEHREQIIKQVKKASSPKHPSTPPPDYWFLNQGPASSKPLPSGYTTFDSKVVAPGSTKDDIATMPAPSDIDERALSEKLHNSHEEYLDTYNMHLKVIEPLGTKKQNKNTPVKSPNPMPPPQMTPAADPAILALASNNDLNVATIARQANKSSNPEPPEDEVVINLH